MAARLPGACYDIRGDRRYALGGPAAPKQRNAHAGETHKPHAEIKESKRKRKSKGRNGERRSRDHQV